MTPFAPPNGHTASTLDSFSSSTPVSDRQCQSRLASPLSNGDNGEGNSAAPLPNGDNGENAHPSPSPTGGRDGREANGRFAKGNLGGPGNPFARRTAGLRRALCEAVTEEDIRSLVRQLVVKAHEGDMAAVKVLFAYAIGRPAEAVDPDTLDLDEWQLFQRTPADVSEMVRVLNSMPSGLACTLLRLLLPNSENKLKEGLIEIVKNAPVVEPAKRRRKRLPSAGATSMEDLRVSAQPNSQRTPN